jgi:hypothetical protein
LRQAVVTLRLLQPMVIDLPAILGAVLFSTVITLTLRWMVWQPLRESRAQRRDGPRFPPQTINPVSIQSRLETVRSDFTAALPESTQSPAHEELLAKVRLAIAECAYFQDRNSSGC